MTRASAQSYQMSVYWMSVLLTCMVHHGKAWARKIKLWRAITAIAMPCEIDIEHKRTLDRQQSLLFAADWHDSLRPIVGKSGAAHPLSSAKFNTHE